MESNIILTKGSSTEELRCYFNAVLRLSQTDKEFPICLDEVWPLVYSRKSDAVEALSENFIQGIDYQVLRQNPQNLQGGRPTNVYHLSLPCMEFFIARKVRPVFEVYRQVFHGVANGALPSCVKTKSGNEYSIVEMVEYISICKDSGFYAWELAGLVGDLLDRVRTLDELRTAATLLAKKQVLETKVLQIVMSLYARQHGLPSTQSPSEELRRNEPKPKSVAKQPYLQYRKPIAETIPADEMEPVEVEPGADKKLRSMKKLLTERGYRNLYAYEVLEALYRHGCVKRVSFKGSHRWEWTLTTQGLTFGRNTAHRDGFPIRPKWMADKFEAMMKALGYQKDGKEDCHD